MSKPNFRFSFPLVVTAALVFAAPCANLWAQKGRAQSGPLKVIPKKPNNVVILTPNKPMSNYDRLKATSKAPRVESLQMVRDNHQTLGGKTVEIKGRVTGFMLSPQGRTLLIACGDASVRVNAPAEVLDLESANALHPGAQVRVLAAVNPQAEANPLLTILAATDAPEAEPLFHDVSADDDNGLIIVPPMTNSMLPPPPRNTGSALPSESRVNGGARILQAPSNPMDLEAQIDAQIPQYEAIVRRHNSKLSDAVVEEIARALLRAGYENNMDPRFLAAIIAVESDFDVHCLSPSGAMGLGQLMPFNIPEAGLRNKSDAWNPTLNVLGTARLLRGHLNDYKDRADGPLLAVAAYNAGPGAVRRAGYRVPPGAQVQRYVWKVYYRYKAFAPDMFK